MKLAFCLFKYFPFGGLERDFLRIAQACLQRGHAVDVYVMQWQGEIPQDLNVNILRARGFTNHRRCMRFAKLLQKRLQEKNYDVVIGFNRMPGLDIYFAADVCYQAKARAQHGVLYRLTSRYRHYVTLEEAVFSSKFSTEILLLTPAEKSTFIKYYGTPAERFHEIPPGVAEDRKMPVDAFEIRKQLRAEFNVAADQKLILMVGANFELKGADRALRALASLPQQLQAKAKLIIVGDKNPKAMFDLAKLLQLENKVQFVGGRHDVLRFLLGADLLLHPAYQEMAGMVLLEALVNELPVLVTENCGYAFHIERARAGLLVHVPFQQEELNEKLYAMLTAPDYVIWKHNAQNYVQKVNLFALTDSVVSFIEKTGKKL